MTKIDYLIGDVHGKFSDLEEVCEDLSGTVLQIGDMGLGFGEKKQV